MKKAPPPSPGFQLLMISAGLIAVGLGMPFALRAWSESAAVSVQMVSPIAGSAVSNTITLSAEASSTAGPIARVEFYADDQLIGIVNSNRLPIPMPPTGLRVVPPD